MAENKDIGARRRWTRDLPPLFLSTALVVVLVLFMPSALRVPQQDPTPVLEYAPVPPEDDQPPNPQGNLSTLSLGSSSTVEEGGAGIGPGPLPGEGSRPTSKRCVGNPPRQTEDPMAPPCVPYFEGDNFGATWRGVTKDEIKVVLYIDRGSYQQEPAYAHGIYDLQKIPPKPCSKGATVPSASDCSHILVRSARALRNYFDERFQTYNRRVHLYAYYTDNGNTGVRGRRADAAELATEVSPFTVIDYAVFDGFNEEFVDAAAGRGMLVFSSGISSHTRAFYQRNAPLAWGFWPDVEVWADLYASYICTEVAGRPVQHSGGPNGTGGFNGQPRKYGFFYTSDPAETGLKRFRELVTPKLADCGVVPAATGTYPQNRFVVDATDPGTQQREAVLRFREAGVTTVLYLGGVEGKFTHEANNLGFYPEIIVAGDLHNDNVGNSRVQNQNVWKNAWAVSYQIREDRPEKEPGYQAAREGDPGIDDDAAAFAATMYRDFFMLYTGIQVAGPRLTPERIDLGFHAIPPKASESPYVAACFFHPGDYSCVKDAMEVWWDPDGTRQASSTPGCWRMVANGERFLTGRWKGIDDVFDETADQPCQGRGGTYRLRLQ